MAVVIRLKRTGAIKKPFSRIVVADSKYPRDGRFIEEIGYYNMRKDPFEFKVDKERAEYWIRNGAVHSATVKSLFKRQGIKV